MPRLLACLLMLAAAGATVLLASSVAAQDVKLNIGLGVPAMPPPAVITTPPTLIIVLGLTLSYTPLCCSIVPAHLPWSESLGVTCQIGSRCDALGCRYRTVHPLE